MLLISIETGHIHVTNDSKMGKKTTARKFYRMLLGMTISAMLLCQGSARWLARFCKGPVPGRAAA
jgi:hypothetical protein